MHNAYTVGCQYSKLSEFACILSLRANMHPCIPSRYGHAVIVNENEHNKSKNLSDIFVLFGLGIRSVRQKTHSSGLT